MRIAFDLDGVLADLEGALLLRAQCLFPHQLGPAPPAADAAQTQSVLAGEDTPEMEQEEEPFLHGLTLTVRQQRLLWRDVCATPNFWETLDELEPGAVQRLAGIAREHHWEIIFLTSRPPSEGDPVQLQSQRWLDEKGFTLPSVFVTRGSRGRIADALHLDVVVDDRPENCLDVVLESKARAILIWRHRQDTVPASARRLGIGGVESISACLDILEKLERGGGLVERLKSVLGLRSSVA